MLSTLPLFYIAQSVNSDDRRTRIQGLRVIMCRTLKQDQKFLDIYTYNNYLLLFWGFLELMKQTFKWNITRLRIPSGRRQSSWLFYNFGQGFEIGTTEDNLVLIVVWLSCSG